MKISSIFDLHLSDRSPSTRKDDYFSSIANKLRYAIQISNEEQVAAILLAGDIFHRKIPSHNSHRLIKELISILSESRAPILAIAGNHDISGTVDNLDKQPISVLEEAGVLKILRGANPELLMENDLLVSVSGQPYDNKLDAKTSADLYNMTFHEESDFNIGIFHQMILPDEMSFFSSYINFSDLLKINSDLIMVGHYHVGFTPSLVNVQDKYFLNGGSLSRGSSEHFNLEKEPKFCILDLNKVQGSVQVSHRDIFVPFIPAEEVFDFAAIERRKENKAMKDFVTNLNEFEVASLTSETPEGIVQILKSMEAPEELLPLADKYLTLVHERMC